MNMMLLWESDRERTTLQKCLHTSALKYALEWSEKRLLWNNAHTLSHSTPHLNAVHCTANRPTEQPICNANAYGYFDDHWKRATLS